MKGSVMNEKQAGPTLQPSKSIKIEKKEQEGKEGKEERAGKAITR
jgi:hypothetical protein